MRFSATSTNARSPFALLCRRYFGRRSSACGLFRHADVLLGEASTCIRFSPLSYGRAASCGCPDELVVSTEGRMVVEGFGTAARHGFLGSSTPSAASKRKASSPLRKGVVGTQPGGPNI